MNKVLIVFLIVAMAVVSGVSAQTNVTVTNTTTGPLLDPSASSNSTGTNAQAQAQTSNNTNGNNLTNINWIHNVNEIGDILVVSSNKNTQLQGREIAIGAGFVGAGVSRPVSTVSLPEQQQVGMQPTGLNFGSLLLGLIGVAGGFVASKFGS